MELIEVFWAFFGAITMAVGFIVGSRTNDKGVDDVADKSMDEKSNVSDSSMLFHVPVRNGSRGSNNLLCERVDKEKMKTALYCMRMSCRYCETEKEALDYAIYCVEKVGEQERGSENGEK